MAVDHNNPQSRNEEILIATIDGKEYDKAPQSRMEELLLELKETIEEGGGGGGTTNYENLSNQPQVNGETLIGDKTGADLGLVDAEEGKGLSTNDYTNEDQAIVAGVTDALAGKQDALTFDNAPTENSNNPVKSGGVYSALADKQDALTAGDYIQFDGNEISVNREIPNETVSYEFKTKGTSEPNITIIVTKRSNGSVVWEREYQYLDVLTPIVIDDAIKFGYQWVYAGQWTYEMLVASDSHAVGYRQSWGYLETKDYTEDFSLIDNTGLKLVIKSELDAAISSAYHHAGTKTCVELVAGLLVAANEGNVYNMTDSGTTTADFIEGAGQPIKAGDNVGIAKISDGVYKFDLLSGFVDTSNFVQKSVTAGLLKNDGTVNDEIEGDVASLKSGLTNVSGEVDTIKNGIVYGFHIDGSVSDPSNRVTYLRDAIGKTPAYMDYNEGSFNYGSWEDAFFMPRPCMVERSGNVAYYLDPNDYTKKTDGTASDIADTTYAGNAMMEWGRDGKKIWMKIEPDSGDANSCNVYIADHRVDATYHDWSFHNCNGVSVDHFYTPIYNGSAVSDGTNNVLRSLSGQYISHTQNASTEITMAGRNNAGSAEIWGTEVYADIVLINMLLTLIGKSTNTQAVFGRGLDSGSETAMKAYVTGALNDKGLFFGYNDGDHGVKVFGMENWWACQWRRYRGHIMVDGVQKVKLTYGTEDGSTAAGYNLTGDNYISAGATPTGTSGQYCDKYEFSPNGAFPKDADNTKATASTHYCDGLWFNNSGTRVPCRGGCSDPGSRDGAWSVNLDGAASGAGWGIGAALSCKPLA